MATEVALVLDNYVADLVADLRTDHKNDFERGKARGAADAMAFVFSHFGLYPELLAELQWALRNQRMDGDGS